MVSRWLRQATRDQGGIVLIATIEDVLRAFDGAANLQAVAIKLGCCEFDAKQTELRLSDAGLLVRDSLCYRLTVKARGALGNLNADQIPLHFPLRSVL
jgi:hypothetical protein